MRNILQPLLAIALSIFLTACGGGGGGGGGSSTPAFSDGSTITPDPNTHPIIVNGGPLGIPNLAFTSVTVCVPNTSQCQTIDNVIVDTGSTGLRLVPSALGSLNLPAQQAANGNALFNCAEFVDTSYAWGSVRRADVKLSNYTASDIAIHIIDGAANTRPSVCGSGDSDDDLSTVANMGGNGILGVSYFAEDCGSLCAIIPGYGDNYFSCGAGGCVSSVAATDIQLQNPVAFFPSDNNGVIIDLPEVPGAGAASVSGSMIFGIGTRSNNSLSGKTVFTTRSSGLITTRYKGVDYSYSFIDSGSNGLFFDDSSIPPCSLSTGFYCPSSTLQLSATIYGQNNNSRTISFSVINADSLPGNFNAFNNLAGSLSGTFDWGLPFFFGRKVYTGFDTDTQEPYTAF